MTDAAKIAVIGAGRMGSVHIGACRAADGVELAAVVESRAAVRAAVASAEGVAVYERAEELLAAGGFDAVVIAAPSDQHLELVREFAAAGVPMLCEKPCGVRVSQVEEAVSSARAAGVLLQVGYWRRFVPELMEIRGQILGGSLERPALVSCYQWDQHLPAAEFQAHSGGLAVDMGVHEFDQLRWLTGQEITAVNAVGAAPGADPPSAVITLTLDSGTLGLVSLGRPYPGPDSCWVEVIAGRHLRVPFMVAADSEQVFRDGIVAQLEAFAEALGSGRPRGATGDDAIAALRIAEQVTDLLTTGKI